MTGNTTDRSGKAESPTWVIVVSGTDSPLGVRELFRDGFARLALQMTVVAGCLLSVALLLAWWLT